MGVGAERKRTMSTMLFSTPVKRAEVTAEAVVVFRYNCIHCDAPLPPEHRRRGFCGECVSKKHLCEKCGQTLHKNGGTWQHDSYGEGQACRRLAKENGMIDKGE